MTAAEAYKPAPDVVPGSIRMVFVPYEHKRIGILVEIVSDTPRQDRETGKQLVGVVPVAGDRSVIWIDRDELKDASRREWVTP